MLPRPNSGLEYATISKSMFEVLRPPKAKRRKYPSSNSTNLDTSHSFILPTHKTTNTSRFYGPITIGSQRRCFQGLATFTSAKHFLPLSSPSHPHLSKSKPSRLSISDNNTRMVVEQSLFPPFQFVSNIAMSLDRSHRLAALNRSDGSRSGYTAAQPVFKRTDTFV